MSGNNEGPGKGRPTRRSRHGEPKKPSAIIDLKATEVKPAEAKPAEAKSTADAKSPCRHHCRCRRSRRAEASAGAALPGALRPASAADTKPTATASARPHRRPRASPPTRRRRRHRPAPAAASAPSSTHLFAGVAGGFLALLGADTIAPQLGLSGPGAGVAEMQRRLAARRGCGQGEAGSAVARADAEARRRRGAARQGRGS